MDSVVAQLRERRLDDGRLLQTGQVVELPNGTAEIRLELNGQTTGVLRLEFGHPKYNPVGVDILPEGVQILPGYQLKDPMQRLIALGARPQDVQVLLDTGSIEVFLDGGRWAGGKGWNTDNGKGGNDFTFRYCPDTWT